MPITVHLPTTDATAHPVAAYAPVTWVRACRD
jgi:hypothetical protein